MEFLTSVKENGIKNRGPEGVTNSLLFFKTMEHIHLFLE